MKQSKFYLFLSIIIVLVVALISCNKEEPRTSSAFAQTITNRTLGSYEVSNGRLKFLSREDYETTSQYLDNASQSQLDSFRNSFNVITPAKAMSEFSEAVCCEDSLSNAQMDSIETLYSSQVRITVNGDGEKEVSLLYNNSPEFMNLDGEFQIGTTIIKQIGTKLVSITKTNLVDPSTLDDSVESDTSTGVFVTDTPLFPPTGCCPSADSKETQYNDGSKKKVVANYEFTNETKFYQDPEDYRKTLVAPELVIKARGKHERRKQFIFYWWGCHKTSMSHDWEVDFDHNLCGVSSPKFVDRTGGASNICEISYTDRFFGCLVSTVPPLGVPTIEVCVNSVFQRVVGNSRVVTISCN